MITDRIGRHEVLLPINQKNYNFQSEEEYSQVIKEMELKKREKKSPNLRVCTLFFYGD